MRPKIPVVPAAGITLLWLALSLLLFLNSSAGDSPSRTTTSAPEGLTPGPDIVVGNLSSLQQFGSSGSQVGLAMGTDSCNSGDTELDFLAMPNTNHPVMAQNLYRLSGGSTNDQRFEQIGQSWLTHGFFALQQNTCGFGCIPSADGTHLGAGCSNADSAGINAGPANMGSRAWVNPFTGLFPSTANSHTGHTHTGSSHRILVETSDLDTTTNPGAAYYAEAQFVTGHEYAWCQSNPGQCNMSNNASYRQFNVVGTTSFAFSPIGSTVRMTPAIDAWPGATIKTIEPAPGIDGRAFLAYKVTGPVGGIWHYEYAIYNQNLDRGIQSFSVPTLILPNAGEGVDIANNVGFHAPPQHPGFADDGTQGDAGFSSTNWTVTQTFESLTWNSQTLAQNPNANAIRWGTLYNFRFDSNRPPLPGYAIIGFFKTGAPVTVEILAPAAVGGTPTPTPIPIATHFEVIAPPVVVMFNGFNFTVRALDQFNNTVTTYPGTVHFTTTAASHLLPPDGTLINGFRTFSADLLSEGTQTITATDTVNSSITGTSNNILVLSDQPTPPPTPTPTPSPACTPLPPTTQGFEDISVLVSNGWHMQNNSQPGPGSTGWFQGNSAVFPAQSGPPTSYIGANFTNGTGTSTISNWLLTPQIPLRNGMVMTFWTRTISTPTFPDRLQVRMSTNNSSTNVGTTATDVGVFTTLLLDINPTYASNVYPNSWAFGMVTISGLVSETTGRLAFRYFVENGGPGGPNSDYIGIDNVQIYPGCPGFFIPTPTPGPPTPTPLVLPTPRPFPTPFPEPATHFTFSVPAKWDVNVPLNFGVNAEGIFGTDPNYSGTVHFTSSDPTAVLPADSTLTNGTGTFTATFHTPGSRTITATDTQTFITGTSLPINVFGSTPTPTATPCTAVIWSEDFDGEIAPALPPGWAAGCWSISTIDPDTPPNCAFAPDQAIVSDCVLDSPPIAIPSASCVLSFRNNFNTEFSDGIFWDGGVLEVSSPNISGGDFLDVTDPTVGGSIPTGGYTGEISGDAQNPLAGRMAWSGNSKGYIDTVINLGPNVSGQTIKLRWRFGSDNAVSAEGWRIDTIRITGGPCESTPTPTPTATQPPSPTPNPTATPPTRALNLSTRLQVQTGDNAGIAGFIITGTAPKRVLVRGIGPSLTATGVLDVLANPTLDLRDSQGVRILANNDWRETQEAEIIATGIPPTDNLEAAIVQTLDPGSYTVILRGMGMTSGVALVEIYDLDDGADSKLANLSTRAFVGTGNDIVIAGFILGGDGGDRVALRGIGPSLTLLGVTNALADPTLDLRDGNGALIASNNNWRDTQDPLPVIEAGLAPANDLESAMVASLSPGLYTVLLAGRNDGTGVGLVEVYDLGVLAP